ncbi:hypothetical protein L3Y34_011345 [Caenorhabditis briggsae]|nr:hypothetical protein L3Y34_011345 [Caenorhabditis briggsae]
MFSFHPQRNIAEAVIQQNISSRWVVDWDEFIPSETIGFMVWFFKNKTEELCDYLQDKRPDMFVNTALNTHPDIMFFLMECFNWKLIPFNKIYICVYKKRTTIEFWNKAVFVDLPHGSDDFHGFQLNVLPFVICFKEARVFSIGVKLVDEARPFCLREQHHYYKERIHDDLNLVVLLDLEIRYPCVDVRYDFDEMKREEYYEKRDFKNAECSRCGWDNSWVFWNREITDGSFGGPAIVPE